MTSSLTTTTTTVQQPLPKMAIGFKVWETGLEAEQILSQKVTFPFKLLFLATNLPYWMLCYVATREALRTYIFNDDPFPSNEDYVTVHICGRPEVYALLLFIVAMSSTIMHSSQLRLGGCMCCTHPERTECFHRRDNLKMFKKIDISCALIATAACVACHAWEDLFLTFVIAFPLFFSGLVLKRMGKNYEYMLVHGLWHIVTAGLVWDAVMTWHR